MTRTLDIVLYTEGLAFAGDTLERQSLGGSETAFIYVGRELARLGHKVRAYCHCPREGLYDGVAYRDLAKFGEVMQSECDLFICSRFLLGFAQPVRARVGVLWLHEPLIEGLNQYLTFLAPKIDIIYGLSDYHCRRIVQSVPELQPKVRKLMNGLDPLLVEEALATVKGKKHQIMFTSRPERGLWEALDIYEQLQDPGLEFLACTYSFPHQTDAVKALEASCRARISRLVEQGYPVSTGSFTKRDLYRHIAESKVVIYPTDFSEIFCISAIEAQACGTVFLTVDMFAFRETVGYERIPFGDMGEFRKRLKALLWDANLRRELEAKGYEHVKPYTWQNVAQILTRDAEQTLLLNATSERAPRRNYDRRGQTPPPYSERLADVLAAGVTRGLG